MKVIGQYNTSIPQFLNLAQSACICENLRPKLRFSNLQMLGCISPDR
ncbi:hypothetical protein D1AOALGA4SA_2062 [Olavius algarvensis Delta 1 endosymbiont]|nr:hypothetical protein D1AOALGA4SA_2062 [Olavius algarvensis Delta 1 endosymbiont]